MTGDLSGTPPGDRPLRATDGAPSYAHLLRLSDDTGVFEHAMGAVPRRERGYCLDDVARALLVATREHSPGEALAGLGERCLAFVAHAQGPDGRFHNRLGYDRHWEDPVGTGDWWGRALWALGTTAIRHGDPWVRETARACFDLGATRRSGFSRSMAFAVLGSAEVMAGEPDDPIARALILAGLAVVGRPRSHQRWIWPELRLTYANAVLPEALIAAGTVLGDDHLLSEGLRLLEWLLTVQTRSGRLSLVAVGGWGPGEDRVVFDQQPIEASSLADACARAFASTGDRSWLEGVDLAMRWFLGDNDAAVSLLNPATGGGFDGITRTGCNTNQGAESTLALISTAQHSHLASAASA